MEVYIWVMHLRKPWLFLGVALAWWATIQPLWACSIPVFRYALERWPPDLYQAVVLHRGALTPPQQALADELMSAAEQSHLNISAQAVDLESTTEERWARLWELTEKPSLPCVVLLYPEGMPATGPAWVGPLDKVSRLVRSPVRAELFERLVAGQSAVWVLLEIGDQAKDQTAATFLEKRLDHLTTALDLPALEPEDIASGYLSIPEDQLKVGFSLLRVSRTNAAEEVLVSMLLGSEGDLRELAEPMAFPVFGRGRALYAIVGAGINEENVDEAGAFLTGACSCQVKEQNPGVDLLMAGDWEERVKGSYMPERELPPLAGLGRFADEPTDKESTNLPAAGTGEPTEPRPGSGGPVNRVGIGLRTALLFVAVAGLLAVGAFTVVLLRRPGVK